MLHFFQEDDNNPAVICSIEVSPLHRGHGLSRQLVEEVSAKYGQLHTSGMFSTSGYAALSKHVPMTPWANPHITDTEEYEFVDWFEGTLKSH